MATLTRVTLVDDIDGTEAAETIEFGIDGHAYEIDLSEKRATELRDALAEFVASSRRVGGPTTTRKPRQQGGPAKPDRAQTQAKREWGRANGFTVSDRGRIPAELDAAYNDRSVRAEKVEANTTVPVASEQKLAAVPSPFETPQEDPSDEMVLAWWTGVLKKPEPKYGKVTAPMRRQYVENTRGA